MGRLVVAVGLLICAVALLTWCSAIYVQFNPQRRLPGKLPETPQPGEYMPVGIVGIVLAVGGSLLGCGVHNPLSWLCCALVLGLGLLPGLLIHNRRLRRR